jgi:hypothetical protein
MSIVNMCHYSDDIRSIFLQSQGLNIIKDLMKSTDDDVLLNGLRLLMTIVAPTVTEAATNGKWIAEENSDSSENVIKQLIKILKEGPSISFTSFNNEITLLVLNLLRAFISHSNSTKRKLMDTGQREKNYRFPDPPYKVVINMLLPFNLKLINE